MAFNLKLVLKALLFSTNQPLTIKDIQTVFTRYHDEQAGALKALEGEGTEGGRIAAAGAAGEPGAGGGPEAGAGEAVAVLAEEGPSAADGTGDVELYVGVPSLVTTAQIREAMAVLAQELKAQNDVYLLLDGVQGFLLVTHPRFAKWIRVQRDEPPPVRLTQSALETLAVVAYRQPVTRSEVEAIRGVAVDNVLGKLLDRELIYVVGRADLPGRPIQYGTTDKFLEFVGVKSLIELPSSDVLSPRQIDAWLNRSTQASPPADAEMGLPLEEGEGASPSLEPVLIEAGEPLPDAGKGPETGADPGTRVLRRPSSEAAESASPQVAPSGVPTAESSPQGAKPEPAA